MKRTSESETIINKRNIAMSAYVPLGLDFRIGKNNKFFNHIHLFTEFRPTVNVTSVPEMGNFFAYGYQLTSGLKFEIQ